MKDETVRKTVHGREAFQIDCAAGVKVLRQERALHNRVTEVRPALVTDITNRSELFFLLKIDKASDSQHSIPGSHHQSIGVGE